MLLWALEDEPSEDVVRLCWEVLTRLNWNERHDAGGFASLILQLRLGHHSSDQVRDSVLAQLQEFATSKDEWANLGFLAYRQGCLGRLPPAITAEFAQQALLDPDLFPLGMSIVAGGSGPPSGIGNLNVWRLFMLAGRASVPHLAEDLFADDRAVRAGAQWCLERILLRSLKDMGWEYSPDMPPEELQRLKGEGMLTDVARMGR